MIVQCPICGKRNVYKVFTDDEKAIVHCMNLTCFWKSEPVERHTVETTPTFAEKKNDWL